jgi:methyl-accepting chemotaxis protein
MNTSKQTMPMDKEGLQGALRIGRIIFIAALVVAGFYFFLAWQLGAWQLYVLGGVITAFCVANGISNRLIRNGRVKLGIWTILVGMYLVFPAASMLVADIGLIFGGAVVILVYVVASQTLSSSQTRQALLFSIPSALAAATMDYIGLDYRLFVPQIQIFIPAITGAIVLVVLFFIARQAWGGSMRNKILIGFVVISAGSVVILTFFLVNRTDQALQEAAFNELNAVQTIKHDQIVSYLEERESDMLVLEETTTNFRDNAITKLEAINTLKNDELASLYQDWSNDVKDVSSDPGVVAGTENLASGFRSLGASQARSLYLGKEDLNDAGDESDYSLAHAEQHDFFSGYTAIHGYEDAFLIDASGRIVYNVHKNESFGADLTAGPYQETNLATLYEGLKNAEAGQTFIADIATFDGQKVMFIGSPIYKGYRYLGVLAYQVSLEQINAIVQDRTGLTESSETYLVGKTAAGNELRSNRVVKEGEIGDPKPGEDADRALAGESGAVFKIGSTGNYEISVFEPVAIPGLNWAMLTTTSADEVFAPRPEGAERDYYTEYIASYGHNDLLLISPGGNVFYSVEKNDDYQTNILTGEYSDSNLSELVAVLSEEKDFEFADYAYYAPTGEPAAFFGVPLLSDENEVEVYIIAEVSLEQIDTILTQRAGLGETGESYLIGPDKLWRSDSRFLEELGVDSTIMNEDYRVDTVASNAALAGESGQAVIEDYRGETVLSVWSPVFIDEPDPSHPEGRFWGLITEIDQSEVAQPAQTATRIAMVIAAVILGVAVISALVFAQILTTPIRSLTEAAGQLAGGDLGTRATVQTEDEIGTLADAFNDMAVQLQRTLETLEQRVADRTRALATSTEVSRRLSTILDRDRLVREVVEQLQAAFGYYHAHIYLYGDDKRNLDMVGGTGDAGRTMLARGHSIGRGQGLVGRAAETGEPVLVPDTSQAEGWLPNPLLPETRAELAVPIAIGDEILGVLDVQHNVTGELTEADADLIQAIANQVAIALQNAQAYERAQRQARREAQFGEISQSIQSAATIDEVLKIAVRKLGQTLEVKRANVELSMRKDQT